MPSYYTELRNVGEGYSAQVTMALPDAVISPAKIKYARGEREEAIGDCIRQVVAIKTAKPGVSLISERKALEVLGSQADQHPGGSRMVMLLAADTRTIPHRLILSTMPRCCNLSTLIQHAPSPWPPGLAWHVFVQLHEFFDYMQEVCKPRHFHGDVNTRNVLIGYTAPGVQRLPGIQITDFGNSYACDETNDNWDLCFLMEEVTKKCISLEGTNTTGDNGLDEFIRGKFQDWTLEQIWRKVGDYANFKVGELLDPTGVRICDSIHELVGSAIAAAASEGEGSGTLRDDIRKVLASSSSQTSSEPVQSAAQWI